MDYLEKLFRGIGYLSEADQLHLFSSLDVLRNQLTKEQYLKLLGDIYDNADEIFNEVRKTEKLEGSPTIPSIPRQK